MEDQKRQLTDGTQHLIKDVRDEKSEIKLIEKTNEVLDLQVSNEIYDPDAKKIYYGPEVTDTEREKGKIMDEAQYLKKCNRDEKPVKKIKDKPNEVLVQQVSNDFYGSCVRKIYYGRDLTDIYIRIRDIQRNKINEDSTTFIPEIYEVGKYLSNDGKPNTFILEEYIKGESFDSILGDHKKLNESTIRDYMQQACKGLAVLHSQNPPIIHKDIKPQNILLSKDKRVKITDFGTSRTEKFGQDSDTKYEGTPQYAPREQYGEGGQTTPATDVYALGKTMYDLVRGEESKAPGMPQDWKKRCSRCKGLIPIIEKCTQERPNDRYKNAGELLKALEGKPRKSVLRRILTILAILLFLFVGFIAAAYVLSTKTDKLVLVEATGAPQITGSEQVIDGLIAESSENNEQIILDEKSTPETTPPLETNVIETTKAEITTEAKKTTEELIEETTEAEPSESIPDTSSEVDRTEKVEGETESESMGLSEVTENPLAMEQENLLGTDNENVSDKSTTEFVDHPTIVNTFEYNDQSNFMSSGMLPNGKFVYMYYGHKDDNIFDYCCFLADDDGNKNVVDEFRGSSADILYNPENDKTYLIGFHSNNYYVYSIDTSLNTTFEGEGTVVGHSLSDAYGQCGFADGYLLLPLDVIDPVTWKPIGRRNTSGYQLSGRSFSIFDSGITETTDKKFINCSQRAGISNHPASGYRGYYWAGDFLYFIADQKLYSFDGDEFKVITDFSKYRYTDVSHYKWLAVTDEWISYMDYMTGSLIILYRNQEMK